ncbi:DUF5335 family protein [Nodosilinea nodulosa]|uniref:DUF5335 family protein n=1 Tax=Nodosilinea nodulosa TaxID=416001 RepID=UPI00031FDDD0|nr:DUF5335 family protein [Nodosilinea nodulosa]
MPLDLSYKRYQLDIPSVVWSEFFEQLTDENRGRLITLTLLDEQMGDFEVLRHTPLYSITYDRPIDGSDLIVTVGRPQGVGEATYAHRVVLPETISIITDEDGFVLSCTITNRDRAQTLISFQS